MAAAQEVNMNAAKAAVLSELNNISLLCCTLLHVKKQAKKALKAFFDWKDVFVLLPTGEGNDVADRMFVQSPSNIFVWLVVFYNETTNPFQILSIGCFSDEHV